MYRHIFDRSDLEQVVSIDRSGKKETRRESLVKVYACGRTDIVLFNSTRSQREYTLHVTETGFSGDLWLLDMLTDEEYIQVIGIAERMRQNAIDFPDAKKLLY